MKRIIALLLASLMCLSLCACATADVTVETTQDTIETVDMVDIKDAVIGTWKRYYELTKDDVFGLEKAGDRCVQTIEFYKGGTGKISWNNITSNVNSGTYSVTWEINDDVVNLTYTTKITTVINGYEYNCETDTLTSVDGSKTFDRH